MQDAPREVCDGAARAARRPPGGAGLAEMTECALPARALPQADALHQNGRRIRFTLAPDDLSDT